MHKYGYEDGRRGFEAKFWIEGDTLKIKIYGSDHGYDWRVNLKACPRRFGYHRGWYEEALKLCNYIINNIILPPKVRIIGHSAGGPIGCILLRMLLPYVREADAITINSPSSGNRKRNKYLENRITSYVHRGDIVRHFPLLYAKPKIKKYGRFTWFWRAHVKMPDAWNDF